MAPIFAQQSGEGQSVVLIHGFCETHQIWKPLLNKLAFGNQITAIDLPCFGKSEAMPAPFTIEQVADRVHQWLLEYHLEDSIIIGHSLGGYVALALANKYPDSIKGLGLFHSTALADDEEKKTSRNKTIEFVEKRGVAVFADSFVSQLFYVKNRGRLIKEIEHVTAMAAATPLATLVSYMAAMRDRPDTTNVLKSLNKPILFIAGDQDTSVPFEKSQSQFEMITQPYIEVLQDVGHMGMFEATAQSFEVINKFIVSFKDQPENDEARLGVLPNRDLKKNLGCG